MTDPVVLSPQGPFSLAASARFLEGFPPAGYVKQRCPHLHLAFPAEGSWKPVGLCVRQEEDRVVAQVYGTADRKAVQDQLARILSLDADGSGFAEVGRRDPVVSRLQERYPGLRPVNFWSPYQAAVWAILSTRVRMTQAANTNARLTRQMGSGQDIHGETLFAFPSRERLKQIEVSDGVPARKAEYLHAVADAALKGRLDSWRLRNVPKQQALALLQEIPGIGPFGAELILLRGAGEPDHFPSAEPRLVEAMTRLYELKHPGRGDLEQISERWRPYRTWTSVLIRNWWQDQAGQLAPR